MGYKKTGRQKTGCYWVVEAEKGCARGQSCSASVVGLGIAAARWERVYDTAQMAERHGVSMMRLGMATAR